MIPSGVQTWWACRPESVPARDARAGVVARCRVPTVLRGPGRHRSFFRVFLWGSVKSFQIQWADSKPNGGFHPTPTRVAFPEGVRTIKPVTCLGTMHLCLDVLTMEQIAHECMHAMVRRLQAEHPPAKAVLEQADGPFWSGRADEEVCYDLGHWCSAIYQWCMEQRKDKP